MTHRKPEFLNDASTLPDAEKDLIAACAKGQPCILGQKRPEPNDTTAPTIRAELIRFLALGGDNDHPVDPFGVYLECARVEDALDLESCQNLRPLILVDCEVREPVTLVDAGLPLLDLSGSHLSGTDANGWSLFADGVQVAGNVFLRAGFEAHGTVRLFGAELGGGLDCSGGTFRASDVALDAEGLKTQRSVFLRDRFEALGTVRLLGAELGGDLDCDGGTFRASDVALHADRLKTRGDVFLSAGFEAHGTVRLLGADLGGNLSCVGGTFRASDVALVADGLITRGDVFLRAGFEAHGTVRLLGAELGGDLVCEGGTFRASDVALAADGLKTRGSVFLSAGFEAHGTVRLLGAELGGNLYCDGGTFRASDVALQLQAAQVDRGFLFRDLSERPKGAVDLSGAHVGMLVDDAESWPAPGKLVLDGFTYKRFAGDAPTDAAKRMAWLERQSEAHLTVDFRPQPFEQVAKVLREMGHAEDAKKIAMAKQRRAGTARWMQAYESLSRFRMMRRTEIVAARIEALDRLIWKLWWRRLGRPVALLGNIGRAAMSWTFGLVIGYGYRPIRALGFAALFITYGFWTFHSAEVAREMVPNNPFLLKQEWKEAREDKRDPYAAFAERVPDFQPFSPVIYAIDTFVPLVNLHQEPHWIPQGGTWARLYLNIHIAMGWLITTLFVASLTGIVKKD
ncbi:MAG: hypothetical protein AAGH74_05280 [Pseudomonadota bacterium]